MYIMGVLCLFSTLSHRVGTLQISIIIIIIPFLLVGPTDSSSLYFPFNFCICGTRVWNRAEGELTVFTPESV